MSESKATLRHHARALLQEHLPEVARLSESLVHHLAKSAELVAWKHIGIFSARRWEPDLLALWKKWPDRVLFPKVLGHTEMHFYPVPSLDDLRPGNFGILEPSSQEPVPLGPRDGLLIPGLLFDFQGNRLGSGKGYYDRYLAQHSCQAWGVCFSFQLTPALPSASHDWSMDQVCTEKGFVFPKRR